MAHRLAWLRWTTALTGLVAAGGCGRTGFEVWPTGGDPRVPGDSAGCGADACADASAHCTNVCAANATCSPITTGFDCVCNPGYAGDGVTCTDSLPPTFTAATINDGATSTVSPFLSFRLTATDASPPIMIRVSEADANGDCQTRYANDGWLEYAGPGSTHERWVLPADGVKKLCAWAKDALGNISTISPTTGTLGVDMDTIAYQTAHLPVVEAFSVVNNVAGSHFGGRLHDAGEELLITWTLSDVEGLATGPVDLYYTTEPVSAGHWTPIVEGYGALEGYPTTTTGSYTGFNAPGAAPFRVKLVAVDMAGNRSIAAISDTQNTPDWGVYAGSSDLAADGVGLGVRLMNPGNTPSCVAIDPVTRDVYVLDQVLGLVRLDARSNRVQVVMANGTTNLPDDGDLPAAPAFSAAFGAIRFGPDGRLYAAPGTDWYAGTSSAIYQIDLAIRHVHRYLGGGMSFDDTATAATVFVASAVFGIDEDGSVYFFTSCSPAAFNSGTAVRLMKATQNADGTAGVVSVFAGNCTYATPATGPTLALASPLGTLDEPEISALAVWNHGATLYYASYYAGTWKILDGQLYASDVTTTIQPSLTYNATTGTLYVADGGVSEYLPNLIGANGDTLLTAKVRHTGTGAGCAFDGVLAGEACVNAQNALASFGDGTLVFGDGPSLNADRPFRVRFVDATYRIRTYLGAPPFHGAGLDRRLARGQFAGIYYKQTTEPGQTAFPSGLYFVDGRALVMGHVDPSTDRITIDWGNQSEEEAAIVTGTTIGPDQALGLAYGGGNVMPFTFDAQGLPWLRYSGGVGAALIRVDASRKAVELQNGNLYWELASSNGQDPYDMDIWPYGAMQNLALKASTAFMIGGYKARSATVTIKSFDFGTGVVQQLMGAAPDTATNTPDNATPGAVVGLSLAEACHDKSSCFVVYRPDQDRLYFSERARVRYITTPSTPSTATLSTLFTATSTVSSFIFSLDYSQVFYLTGGNLRCHDLSSGAAWCNDTTLGPPTAVLESIRPGPNQLTWRDSQHLLISNYDDAYAGQIYEYSLPLP